MYWCGKCDELYLKFSIVNVLIENVDIKLSAHDAFLK